jgi:molybdopterin/thiamine biosynthesis adenylyltransferase/proteasome lid subunit RPN8/RPN11
MRPIPSVDQVTFSRAVLVEIASKIAAHDPERGGALLGIVDKPEVSYLILDQYAATTSASYHPSQWLLHKVQEIEARTNLQFKGVIHSHPDGLDRLSSPDYEGIREGLEINPHLPYFIAPVITHNRYGRSLQDHEIELPNGKMSVYIAFRRGRDIDLRAITTNVSNDSEEIYSNHRSIFSSAGERMRVDIHSLCQNYEIPESPKFFTADYEGTPTPTVLLQFEGGLEFLIFYSETYPNNSPTILATLAGSTEQLQFNWMLATPPEDRFMTAIAPLLDGRSPNQKVYGLMGKCVYTAERDRASLAGWSGFYSANSPDAHLAEIQKGLFARSGGVLSQSLIDKCVAIIGTGSVGSYVAEQLTRAGVGKFILIDPETVEAANLSRSTYDIHDLGQPKVQALARRLFNINPALHLERSQANLLDYEPQSLAKIFESIDLVIAATDEPQAQQAINRFAYWFNKPAIYIGLYAGAKGGEVIVTIPDKTRCFACATQTRSNFETDTQMSVSTHADYGTGRLVGEVAIAADIHHVSSAAVKMALSLLLPEDSDAQLKDFLTPAIAKGQNFLTMSMVPAYWFYPQIFGDTAGQFAYQSAWLSPVANEACPVCGNIHERVNPLSLSLRPPSAASILEAISLQ